MKTFFISDLHLSDQRPDIIQQFQEFIETKAIHADALYILGDLFEFWIGDDDKTLVAQQVATSLMRLAEHNVPCYYIHGNRDFMIGQRYAKRCKMTLLPEEHLIQLYGKQVLILHGDTLCTDDEGYQKYRAITQKTWLRKIFLCLPLFVREHIANKIRGNSKKSKVHKTSKIMDVNQDAVTLRFAEQQIDYMIHGHTHRPEIHGQDTLPDNQQLRVVLGDWYQQSSILEVSTESLSLSANQQQLSYSFKS